MYDIVCSLVIYKNDRNQLIAAIDSFLNTELNVRLVLIDNSPTDDLSDIKIHPKIEYISNPINPGYGTSHNIAISKYINNTKFHLVLNPDIYFNNGVLEDMINFMNLDIKIGLMMPKILYPNEQIQYLAKLLPRPADFFIRRLLPNSSIKTRLTDTFELKFSGYNKIMEVPYLSGCFMLFSAKALREIKGFDENIFMHMEDLDITRTCWSKGYKTIYYPHKSVYHDHLFKSTLNLANLNMYLRSAIYYFNKWGWFFDLDRKRINKSVKIKISKLV